MGWALTIAPLFFLLLKLSVEMLLYADDISLYVQYDQSLN